MGIIDIFKKISVLKLKEHLLFLLLVIFPLELGSEIAIEIFPFKNKTDFKRKKFGHETAEIFSEELRKGGGYRILLNLNKEEKKNREDLSADNSIRLSIKGIIEKFSLSTYGIMAPGRWGFVHYTSEVTIKLSVSSNGRKLKTIRSKSELKDNNLGLTMLGGPGTMVEVESLVFKDIQKYHPQSAEFKKTLPGRALYNCMNDLVNKFKKDFPSPEKEDIPASSRFYSILDVEDETVYINGGYADLLKVGDHLMVFRKGKKLLDPDTKKVVGHKEKYI